MTTWLLIITFLSDGMEMETVTHISREHCLVVVEQARQGRPPVVDDRGTLLPVVAVRCLGPEGVTIEARVEEVGL